MIRKNVQHTHIFFKHFKHILQACNYRLKLSLIIRIYLNTNTPLQYKKICGFSQFFVAFLCFNIKNTLYIIKIQ